MRLIDRAFPALRAVAEDQRHSLLLWAPVALGAGIATYFNLQWEPTVTVALASGLAGLAVLGLAAAGRGAALTTLLALAALGFAVAKLQTERMAAPVLGDTYFGAVAGRVVALDRSQRNAVRLMLDQVYLPGVAEGLTPRRVRVVLASPPAPEVLTPGARVMMRARLTPPPPPVEPRGFDFRRHAWFKRLGAIGYSAEPVVLERPLSEAAGVPLFRLRMRISAAIRAEIPGRAGGFSAAILTGDRSGVDPEDLVDLRASKLAHLLAISGLHMGLLTGVVFAALRIGFALWPAVALRWPGKKFAAVGALLAGACYLALSGGSVATQRAFVMAAVIFAAVLADRPALTLRAVALAALIVLIWQPISVFGPGFQMSFAATISLIAVYDALKDRSWWRAMQGGGLTVLRGLIALVMTSAVAGLGTAPFSAFHFNQLAQFGLLANVLAVPAMGFVVMPAALCAFVLWPLGLQGLGFALMALGIDHILNVAHWVAGLDGSLIHVPTGPGWALGAFSIGGLALVILRGRIRAVGLVMMSLASLAWASAERPAVLIAPGGGLVGVLQPDGRVLNRARREGFAARVWLENDGDTAEQADAFARAAPRPDGPFSLGLSDGAKVSWLDKIDLTSDLPQGSCAKGALLIAPKLASPPPGECIFIGAEALSRDGAHAFHSGRLDMPETTFSLSGTRPWTHPGQ